MSTLSHDIASYVLTIHPISSCDLSVVLVSSFSLRPCPSLLILSPPPLRLLFSRHLLRSSPIFSDLLPSSPAIFSHLLPSSPIFSSHQVTPIDMDFRHRIRQGILDIYKSHGTAELCTVSVRPYSVDKELFEGTDDDDENHVGMRETRRKSLTDYGLTSAEKRKARELGNMSPLVEADERALSGMSSYGRSDSMASSVGHDRMNSMEEEASSPGGSMLVNTLLQKGSGGSGKRGGAAKGAKGNAGNAGDADKGESKKGQTEAIVTVASAGEVTLDVEEEDREAEDRALRRQVEEERASMRAKSKQESTQESTQESKQATSAATSTLAVDPRRVSGGGSLSRSGSNPAAWSPKTVKAICGDQQKLEEELEKLESLPGSAENSLHHSEHSEHSVHA